MKFLLLPDNVFSSPILYLIHIYLSSVLRISLQVFMVMSVMGVVFQGYFFAFHLLNIVNNNQLLRGVIQAVTQNGELPLQL